jgi:ElaB/YqjD/DUF883 family membrane-anchored ribosome-binding protein
MRKKKRVTDEVVELANLIWGECREGSLLQDSRGRPSYILALNLAKFLLEKAYEAGFDDPLSEIDWRAIVDCELEYSEMIGSYERWLRDHVGRTKSIDKIVYSEIDVLRLNIESLKDTIRSLESLSSTELAEMGLTEEERQRQLEELRSDLAKLEAELKRLERQKMLKRRVKVVARVPEREVTRKLIEYAVKRPETPLGRRVRQTMLWEIPRKPVEKEVPPPVSEEEVFKEAQRIYSEFMSFHNELVNKFKPVSERINSLIKQLHSLEGQFKDASEAGDLERLRALLPGAEKVEKELGEAFEEADKLLHETLRVRNEWRSRRTEVIRKLFELKRKAPGRADEIHKMALELSELSEPYVRWEFPPEWVYGDKASIKSRAKSLVKRIKSRIAELEYKGRAVVKRKLKEVMRYEDFINKIRDRLEYYGVTSEVISRFIGETEAELRKTYEEADYAELEEILAMYVMYFKSEYLPVHFTTLSANLLVNKGVRVDHPRQILLYGMWIRPRIYYLKPRFDSWIRDCITADFTVRNKPITIKPGKTHLIIDPGVNIESAVVALADDTIYLVNAPAIGYVYDPDNKYVEYYYYPSCTLLGREGY